jgi:hypothetical protein
LATATSDVIRGQAVVLSNLGGIGGGAVGKIGNAIKIYFKEVLGIQALQDLGASTRPRPRAGRFFGGGSLGTIYDPKAKKIASDQLKETKKLTAEQKKQAALKKAGTVFDQEQIQLIAALKGKLSEEERTRIQAQLAILNENDVLARNLTKQILMAQDATGGLYNYFLTIGDAKIKNPFSFLDDWIKEFQSKLNNLKFPTGNGATATVVAASTPSVTVTNSGASITSSATMGTPFGQAGSFVDSMGTPFGQAGSYVDSMGTPFGQAGTTVVVNVSGSVISEQDLTETIARNLQNSSLSSGKVAQLERYSGFFL